MFHLKSRFQIQYKTTFSLETFTNGIYLDKPSASVPIHWWGCLAGQYNAIGPSVRFAISYIHIYLLNPLHSEWSIGLSPQHVIWFGLLPKFWLLPMTSSFCGVRCPGFNVPSIGWPFSSPGA